MLGAKSKSLSRSRPIGISKGHFSGKYFSVDFLSEPAAWNSILCSFDQLIIEDSTIKSVRLISTKLDSMIVREVFDHWSMMFELTTKKNTSFYIFAHLVTTGIEFIIDEVENYALLNLENQYYIKAPYEFTEPIPATRLMELIFTYEGLKREYKAIIYSNNCINFAMFIVESLAGSDNARAHLGFKEMFEQRKKIQTGTSAADTINGFLHRPRPYVPINERL